MQWKNFLFVAILSLTSVLTADECCDPCNGWDAHIDYLYMKARNCHFDYAIPFDGTNAIGSVKSLSPEYDSGFRIGFDKECDCFTYGVNYTWFRSNRTTTTTEPVTGDLAGTLLIDAYTAVTQATIDLARAKWDLDYDLVDITAGYHLCSSECLDFSMFGGVKLAFINQDFEALYSTNVDITGATNTFDRVNQKLDMDAYGLQFGFNTDYNGWNCLGLYGLFSLDVLAADFDRTFRYTTSANGGLTTLTRADLKENCWDIVSVLNLGIGLKYRFQSCLDSTLSIGYEFHQWLGTPGFLKHTNESGEVTFDRSLDNMSFDGLTIGFEARF